MLVYAVLSAESERAVELFVRREDADRFLDEVRGDEPELADALCIEPVELDTEFRRPQGPPVPLKAAPLA